MDVLQNYYGLAIRENLDCVKEMAKSVNVMFVKNIYLTFHSD
jgi:hypothetical protein